MARCAVDIAARLPAEEWDPLLYVREAKLNASRLVLFVFCSQHSNLEKKNIVLYTNGKDVLGKANAAYLIGAYAVSIL